MQNTYEWGKGQGKMFFKKLVNTSNKNQILYPIIFAQPIRTYACSGSHLLNNDILLAAYHFCGSTNGIQQHASTDLGSPGATVFHKEVKTCCFLSLGVRLAL